MPNREAVFVLRQLVLVLSIAIVSSAAIASSIGLSVLTTDQGDVEELKGKSMGQLIHSGMTDPRFEARAQHYLAEHGFDHPQKLDLAGLTPIEAAAYKINVDERNGRSVAEWVALAKASNLLSLQAQGQAQGQGLVDAVARLNAAAGFPLTDEQLADVRAQADAMPGDVRAPFATLVAATADAYAAQSPIAAGIVERVPLTDDTLAFMMTDDEREATLAGALGLVAAQNAFRAAVKDVAFPATSTPIFADPNGLVILGSTGDDTFERTGVFRDAALIVDPSGNDVYNQLAGGACPDVLGLIHECNGLVVSVAVDLAGDDSYNYDGVPTNPQGSASLGGIGILVDAQGSDSYYANFVQPDDVGPFWGGVLGYIDAGNQGYGLAAVGILLDATGNDVYEADVASTFGSIWGFSQGFGNAGGVGIASDGTGDDEWLAYGFDIGLNGGFQGLYPGGTGFFGGLGIMTDTGLGADEYHAWDSASTTDFYAYGFGAFGGTGIFYEDGGNDNYEAVESATNPFIVPLLNCAYGTASFAGLGVFLEMGGNDRYFGDSISPRTTATMNEGFGGPAEGEGVFLDVSGDDGHFMEAHSGFVNNYQHTYGRGAWLGGGEGLFGNTVGIYLDLQGNDQYTGASPSQNNAAWPVGLDLEAGSVPGFFLV